MKNNRRNEDKKMKTMRIHQKNESTIHKKRIKSAILITTKPLNEISYHERRRMELGSNIGEIYKRRRLQTIKTRLW